MNWPGEQLLIKLWDTLADRGICGALKPLQIRREGKAHIEVRQAELLALAQAEVDANEIRSGTKRLEDFYPELTRKRLTGPTLGERIEPTLSLELLADVVLDNRITAAIREEINVAKAIVHAESVLAEDPQEAPQASIDGDWLHRWRDGAAHVSSEKLQQLWGQVLAGELKAPSTYSLRLLDFIKNLSQQEAQLIESIAPLVVSGRIWRNDKALNERGITLNVLLELQSLGIVGGVEAMGMTTTFNLNFNGHSSDPQAWYHALVCNNKALILLSKQPQQPVNLPVYLVTKIGQQILSLGSFKADINYLDLFGKSITVPGVTIMLGDVRSLSATHFQVIDEVIIQVNAAVQP